MATNINTATYDDLLLLENIGKSRANAILQERSKKKILSIQDLKLIPDIPENVWDNLVDTGKINFEPEEGSLKFNHEMQEYVRSLQENLRDKDKQLQSFNAAIEEQGQEFKTQMTGIEAQHQKNIAEIHTQFEEKLVNMQNQFKDNMEKEKVFREEREHHWNKREKELVQKHELELKINQMAPSGIYGKDPTLSEISVPSKTALLKHQTIPIKEEIKENKLPTVTKNQTTEDRYVKSSIEGPLTPKMSTFDGKADWRPYFAQFCHIAKRCKWSEQQKLDNLIVCLRDKALKFYSSRPVEIKDNFQVLCKKMNDRFGRKDLPHILRRQLQEAKQGSDESLEEFADKVQELATDGYPESPDYFIQIVAVDAFLKGCAEKQAALVAMDKNPSSLDEATQYMKSAITNQRLIMGSRKTTDIKRVTFEDPAELKDSDAVIRAIYREKPQLESSKMDIRVKKNEDDIQEMKKSLSQILNILKGKDERSRSPIAFRKSSPAPSPDRKRLENSTCFACGNLGHFAASCPKRNFDRSRSPSPRVRNTDGHLNYSGLKI
ncbi:CAST [Mytilus edulis]|uniref:ERC2 n=1 Tax=Mytilus edulis TaxID=6550 RepID=A0A8S3QXU1_MYTED|nr:CAST [Mytilus edulis]